jgi:thymidylate synthase (FAD)
VNERKQLLDHGYIEAVEHWGSDERIIEAARMSTDKGFQGWGGQCDRCNGAGKFNSATFGAEPCKKCKGEGETVGDEKLLRYLWEHKHATPFEMAGLIIEVQAPIFVFREWHRHRTQSFNELSARYTPMPDISYVPSVERLMLNAAGSNKQAGTVAGADALNTELAEQFRLDLMRGQVEAEERYQWALRAGVPKELARLHVPVARYSRMRASANLRNWLAFLTLRNDPAAQWEIRQYAIALQSLLAERFPRTLELFAGSPAR